MIYSNYIIKKPSGLQSSEFPELSYDSSFLIFFLSEIDLNDIFQIYNKEAIRASVLGVLQPFIFLLQILIKN